MPLLHGQTLRDRLKQAPPLTLAEILRIGREIAEGLAAAHELGLIHRDVKPGNSGSKKRAAGSRSSTSAWPEWPMKPRSSRSTGTIVGTPAFMAPEQARGQDEFDCRSDLFSLGGILYRMVTGKLPFPADHTTAMLLSLLSDDPVPPRQLNPGIPPALEALILRLLAKDPDQRPQSARAVVEAIRRWNRPESSASGSSAGHHGAGGRWRLIGSGPPATARRRAPGSGRNRGRTGPAGDHHRRSHRFAVNGPLTGRATGPCQQSSPRRSAPTSETPTTTPPQGQGPAPRVAVETWPTPPPAHSRLPGLLPAPQSLAGLGHWQVETRSPRDAVLALSWSPDRQRLACAAGERVVRIYEAESMKLAGLLVGHTKPVFSVEWSPDGRRLATAGGDGTIRLWMRLGAPGPVLRGHSGSVWCLRWNPVGSRLASAGNDKSVRIWNADGTTELVLDHPSSGGGAWRGAPTGSSLFRARQIGSRSGTRDGTPGPLLKGHTGERSLRFVELRRDPDRLGQRRP